MTTETDQQKVGIPEVLERIDELEETMEAQMTKRISSLEETLAIQMQDRINLKQAATLTSLSVHWLRKMAREKKVPHYRHGKFIEFDKNELLIWKRNNSIRFEQLK